MQLCWLCILILLIFKVLIKKNSFFLKKVKIALLTGVESYNSEDSYQLQVESFYKKKTSLKIHVGG